MDINSGGVIFAGANLLGIYKSNDNGATWNICNNGLTTANIYKLSISPNDDIYLGTVNGGAFRSTDEGNSWMQIGLTGYEVRCFAFAPNGAIFSGTNDGVFKSTDNGGSWTHLSSSGLNNPYVHCLFFNYAGYLFAGTGISLCRSVEPVITSVDDSFSEVPQSFLLLQNYPNPFNPSTRIQYAIGSRQFVTLKIYDILGNEIATLVDEEKPAGSYEFEFNLPADRQGPSSINHQLSPVSSFQLVRNLVSGIYFCRLQTDNYSKTIKMLYLK
jgi:hypothetical protein